LNIRCTIFFKVGCLTNHLYPYLKMNCTRELLSEHPGVTLVELKGLARPGATVRPAVHFIVLADKSGSMSAQQKMNNVKLSLYRLLDFLGDDDFLTVAPFNHEISHPPLIYGESCNSSGKESIRLRINTIAAGGTTNIGEAIKEVPRIMSLELPSRPNGIKTGVLLLTDGEATEGLIENDALLDAQRNVLEMNPRLTLSTVGYGDDHNVPLLSSLAISGSYNIVHTLTDVASVFGSILGGLRTTVAQATHLIVPAHVRQRTTFKTTLRADGLQEILIGDIIEGGQQVILLEGLEPTEPLRIEYNSVLDATPVTIENVIGTTSEEGQRTGQIAFLRCETIDLLTLANTYLTQGNGEPPTEILNRITAVEALLRLQPISPTVTTLLQELNRARRYVTMPPAPPELMRTRSNQLSQHTTYLGTGGGGGGMLSSVDPDDPPISSPFASTYQRDISIAISSAIPNEGDIVQSSNPNIPLSISPITNNPDTPYPVQLVGDTGGSLDFPYRFGSSTSSNPPPHPRLRHS
jgi:von Willebrand factor type A domain